MKLQFEALPLEGAMVVEWPEALDARGHFVKIFHGPEFRRRGLDVQWEEVYYSVSHQRVIRGLHFQTPPHDHAKLVYCPHGAILDLMVDLRKSSPTYGKYHNLELTAENRRAVFIPRGFAHGFKALSPQAITQYLVSTAYAPEHDKGILYNSVGFDWGLGSPQVSDRDLGFPPFSEFVSPF